jgi:hypothetical protein
MAQETGNACIIPTFERNRYFAGKPMMVGDFEAEQQYMIGKNRLQNRLIHGAGIICGLQLSNPKIVEGKLTVDISEGAALDCCGNLIVVNGLTPVEVHAESTLPEGALGQGTYYLYIRYSECIRQPIMATTSSSSCEEVCCYNRIRETFEIVLSKASPEPDVPAFAGTVKTNGGTTPIAGARVKARAQGAGPVKAETLADNSGSFTLKFAAGDVALDVEASATGFAPSTIAVAAGQKEPTLNFILTAQAGGEPADVCNRLVQEYFEGHSLTCSGCDNPKVFLSVVEVNGTIVIDQTSPATRRNRSIVYSNPMLHDLLCDHVSDFNNPHRTTAQQIRALRSVNNVGNDLSGPYVSNINLVSKAPGTIEITPDAPNHEIDLQLSASAVNNLLNSDGTITITPNGAARSITVKTNPATSVSSVVTNKVVGVSTNFAREDHQHDLANGVVTREKFDEDVYKNLLTADTGITIRPDFAAKQIKVGAILVNINDRSVDPNGRFRLTAGKGIQIENGPATNELVISGTAIGQQGVSFSVPTGLVRFQGMRAGEARSSPPIKHGLDAKTYAIVLGLDLKEEIKIGDHQALSPEQNTLLVEARYEPGLETFEIIARDVREQGQPAEYQVRWWAVPSTTEVEPVISPQPSG